LAKRRVMADVQSQYDSLSWPLALFRLVAVEIQTSYWTFTTI